MSGQLIPTPRPIRRQFCNWAGVECASLGYHSSGAVIVRPSVNVTNSVPSFTSTAAALALSIAFVKVSMPPRYEELPVFGYKALNPSEFRTLEPAVMREPDGIKPELCCHIVAFNVYMHRFYPIIRIDEEPVRSDFQNFRHSTVDETGCTTARTVEYEDPFVRSFTARQRGRGHKSNVRTTGKEISSGPRAPAPKASGSRQSRGPRG